MAGGVSCLPRCQIPTMKIQVDAIITETYCNERFTKYGFKKVKKHVHFISLCVLPGETRHHAMLFRWHLSSRFQNAGSENGDLGIFQYNFLRAGAAKYHHWKFKSGEI